MTAIIDPARCVASGVGCRGGPSGTKLRMIITTFDQSGHRIRSGGASILVFLTLPRTTTILSQAVISDSLDGSYSVEYVSPDKKGSYELHIQINGMDACGSPCPIFFGDGPLLGAGGGGGGGGEGAPIASLPSSSLQITNGTTTTTPHDNATLPSTTATTTTATTTLPPGGIHPTLLALTQQLQDRLKSLKTTSCAIRIINLSPMVNESALSSIVSVMGSIKSISFQEQPGGMRDAIVIYTTSQEADKALALSSLSLGGKQLVVEKHVDARELAKVEEEGVRAILLAKQSLGLGGGGGGVVGGVGGGGGMVVDTSAIRARAEAAREMIEKYSAAIAAEHGKKSDKRREERREERGREERGREEKSKREEKKRSRSRSREARREQEKKQEKEDAAAAARPPPSLPPPPPPPAQETLLSEWDLL